MHRRAAVMMLAATAALALGACGPTATKTANEPKAPVAANPASPADTIAAAYDKTLAANTAKFTAKLDTKLTGHLINLTGDGSMRFNPLAGESTLKGKGTDVHIITIGKDVYIQGTDKKWTKLDTSKSGNTGGNDPMDYLGFLKGVTGPVTSTGTTTVHGSPATGYKVTVDFAKAVKNSPGGKNGLLQGVQAGGITTAPVDIWLDNQGRLAQIKYHFDANSRGADLVSDGTVSFYEYGTTVNITAPTVG